MFGIVQYSIPSSKMVNGSRWCSSKFRALWPEDRRLDSTSSHYVATLDKLLTQNCEEGSGKPPHTSRPRVA